MVAMVRQAQTGNGKVSDFNQLVVKTRKMLSDVTLQREHIVNGTTEEFYLSIIQQVILDVTLLPIVREDHHLEPIDDSSTMHDAILEVVHLVSYTFGKPQSVVERDFRNSIKKFPVDDLRQAATLRAANRLN